MNASRFNHIASLTSVDYATALERSLMLHVIEAEKALVQKGISEQLRHELELSELSLDSLRWASPRNQD